MPSEQLPSDAMAISFHVIYSVGRVVSECFVTAADFDAAEKEFQRQHPDATYWEIGIPATFVTVH